MHQNTEFSSKFVHYRVHLRATLPYLKRLSERLTSMSLCFHPNIPQNAEICWGRGKEILNLAFPFSDSSMLMQWTECGLWSQLNVDWVPSLTLPGVWQQPNCFTLSMHLCWVLLSYSLESHHCTFYLLYVLLLTCTDLKNVCIGTQLANQGKDGHICRYLGKDF